MINSNIKIAVTGSSGYIGSRLIKRLEPIYGNILALDKAKWDIRNKNNKTYEDIDIIIHLAALVSAPESVKKRSKYIETNYEGTKNIIRAFPNSKIIFTSTALAENPTCPYGKSKKMAEEFIIQACKEFVILRLSNVGGGCHTNSGSIQSSAIKAIKNKEFRINGGDFKTKDGTAERDYIHIEDVIDSILKFIELPSFLETQNLYSGKTYTVLEYLDCFKKVNKISFRCKIVQRRAGDSEIAYSSKISKYFEPKRTLKDITLIYK